MKLQAEDLMRALAKVPWKIHHPLAEEWTGDARDQQQEREHGSCPLEHQDTSQRDINSTSHSVTTVIFELPQTGLWEMAERNAWPSQKGQ